MPMTKTGSCEADAPACDALHERASKVAMIWSHLRASARAVVVRFVALG